MHSLHKRRHTFKPNTLLKRGRRVGVWQPMRLQLVLYSMGMGMNGTWVAFLIFSLRS